MFPLDTFTPDWLRVFLIETVLGQIVVVTLGALFANVILGAVRWLRYGRWSVVISKNGQVLLDRDISSAKAKMIRSDQADLSVYLKGVASPYAWLNLDLLSPRSLDEGLLVVDQNAKTYRINLDKNPVVERREVCRYPHAVDLRESS